MNKKDYIRLLLAITIFVTAEIGLDYVMNGSSIEVKLSLAFTLIIIFYVIAKQLNQSKQP
jgi:hypothetical protein